MVFAVFQGGFKVHSEVPDGLSHCQTRIEIVARATEVSSRWLALRSADSASRLIGIVNRSMPEQKLPRVNQRPEHVFPSLALVHALVDVRQGQLLLVLERRTRQGRVI